ncbi:MAG: hypothetical protein KAT46_07665 [Deltaproteobacteria bacterium]|nr:hypothetical protein [Deltaproteobacteria bacterium]
MSKFEVCVRGNNFLMKTEDGIIKKSFYAARYAEAKDMSEAAGIVMDIFREELKDLVLNDKDDMPEMRVVETNEIYFFENAIEIGEFTFSLDGYVWVEDDTLDSEMIKEGNAKESSTMGIPTKS